MSFIDSMQPLGIPFAIILQLLLIDFGTYNLFMCGRVLDAFWRCFFNDVHNLLRPFFPRWLLAEGRLLAETSLLAVNIISNVFIYAFLLHFECDLYLVLHVFYM